MDERAILGLVDAALRGDKSIAQMAVRKLASKIRVTNVSLYEQLTQRLASDALRSKDIRKQPLPVDSDSRQSLVRVEDSAVLSKTPIFSDAVFDSFEQVLLERKYIDALLSEGLQPTKSLIFQGPPGVGKTMSARWIAQELGLPLLVLDLATVMSSFLGKTGSNVRAVLEHAMSFPCVLLLDEFDAIAKRRDDDRELGELKRLVTVLLQTIDDWPSTSLLIAATNHGELLDPAIWRRFDMEITFTMPCKTMIGKYLSEYWPEVQDKKREYVDKFEGMSFSNIDRELTQEKRASVISAIYLRSLAGQEELDHYKELSVDDKKRMAVELYKQGLSQRAIATKLGVGRPTVKKAIEDSQKG
ncbi:TPA: AAA family ATPase [Vibrio parahaemolyticus]|uniref:AAA family ATPase n=2 Tax=Vibrio parahaemolyticus TaxID=670 RepID=UPI00111E3AB1|nr:ATP-binding protein [Vibrio parahaemolyticus]ELA9881238.1 AAA family ATPase [Vibrio parahaemolyticus]MBE4485810.1 AAA family ATPase [Vibrio parahaemolyticus]MBE4490438.1 AAA family ATPase [Vibrio parahaemolyticus]MBE4500137.1 AAA family ATPase [Vibrio parahaemolyticus]MBE4504035.1 AAA family ATPase [Vibrio parahaemolyticus]